MRIVNGRPETAGYSQRQVKRSKPWVKEAIAEPQEHRCQNPACNKPMLHKRANAKYCTPRCRAQVQAAARAKEIEDRDDDFFISQACRYPLQQQAELLSGDMRHRHPYHGRRPHRYSGYCVIKDCECKCHPWNQIEENEEEALI